MRQLSSCEKSRTRPPDGPGPSSLPPRPGPVSLCPKPLWKLLEAPDHPQCCRPRAGGGGWVGGSVGFKGNLELVIKVNNAFIRPCYSHNICGGNSWGMPVPNRVGFVRNAEYGRCDCNKGLGCGGEMSNHTLYTGTRLMMSAGVKGCGVLRS